MADLISFSNETKLGPIGTSSSCLDRYFINRSPVAEALTKFASKIRDSQSLNPTHSISGGLNGTSGNPGGGSNFSPFQTTNGLSTTPAVTLYSSAPPSINASSNLQPAPTTHSPQTGVVSADNSPLKQHKTIPQQPQGSGSAPSSAPAASTPASASTSAGPNTTPSMSNASLKRKQTSDTASPTTANAEQPPSKRGTRKRGRTTGGG